MHVDDDLVSIPAPPSPNTLPNSPSPFSIPSIIDENMEINTSAPSIPMSTCPSIGLRLLYPYLSQLGAHIPFEDTKTEITEGNVIWKRDSRWDSRETIPEDNHLKLERPISAEKKRLAKENILLFLKIVVCAIDVCKRPRRRRRRGSNRIEREEKEREQKEEEEKEPSRNDYENYIDQDEENEDQDEKKEEDTEEYESDYSSPSTPSSQDSDDPSSDSSTDTDFEADPTRFYTLDTRSETFASTSLALHARNVGFPRGADSRTGLVCPSTQDPLLLRCRNHGNLSNESTEIINESWKKFKDCNWKPHIPKALLTELAILDGDAPAIRRIRRV